MPRSFIASSAARMVTGMTTTAMIVVLVVVRHDWPALRNKKENPDREQQAEHNALPDAADGAADQQRLVVKEGNIQVGRQFRAKFSQFLFHAVRDGDGAAVGLAADIEEHGVLAVGRDDLELRVLTGHTSAMCLIWIGPLPTWPLPARRFPRSF